MTETDLAVLVGQLQERSGVSSITLTDLSGRVDQIEARPTVSPDAAQWLETHVAAIAAAKEAESNRQAFWGSEKKAVIGLLITAPLSGTIGFGVSQLFQHLHIHL